MRIIKIAEQYKVDSEQEAKEAMERFRDEAAAKGYSIAKCGYTYKCKKSKGQIVEDCFLVDIVKDYGPIWEV